MNNVVVVGGGPVGLSAALAIKLEGFEVTVIEEHPEIGKPVQCAGLISKKGCDELKLPIENCILNSVRGARIYSPSGKVLEIARQEHVAYVIDREKFDRTLYKKALNLGVEVKTNTKLIDARGTTIFTKVYERGGLLKADFILGADGVASKVRELMKIETKTENFLRSYQMKVQSTFDADFVEVHLGNFAKNFFAWIIPESEKIARVGLATADLNAKKAFDEFVKVKQIEGDFFDESSGLIPIGKPIKEAVVGNMLIAGDAAFHTKSTTGGGIITGIEAARIAAKTIASYYKFKKPIKNYDKNLAPLNKELEIHWRIRSYLNSLTNDQIDKLFLKMENADIPQFLAANGDMDKPSRFLGKALLKPNLWGFMPEILKFLRG